MTNPRQTCPECGHHKRGLVDALEEAFQALQDKEERRKLGRKARKFATAFDARAVVNLHWKPFLAQLAEELEADKNKPKLFIPKRELAVPSPTPIRTDSGLPPPVTHGKLRG